MNIKEASRTEMFNVLKTHKKEITDRDYKEAIQKIQYKYFTTINDVKAFITLCTLDLGTES